MKSILIVLFIILIIIYLYRIVVEKSEANDLNLILDKYGAILVLDGKGLIAILYKDRTIDWMKEVSLFKMIKIKEISDHFEDEYQLLEDEANNKISKDWRKDDAID